MALPDKALDHSRTLIIALFLTLLSALIQATHCLFHVLYIALQILCATLLKAPPSHALCILDCYSPTALPSARMSCALSHTPPALHVARTAAQAPSGIAGRSRSGLSLLQVAAALDDADTVLLSIARGLSPVPPRPGGKVLSPVGLAIANGAPRALAALLRIPLVRDTLLGSRAEVSVVLRLALMRQHEHGMAVLPILLDSLGSALFLPRSVITSTLYASVVDLMALQEADFVDDLRRLKAMGADLMRAYEVVPPPGLSSGDPTASVPQLTAMGLEVVLVDPAPQNLMFLREWFLEYSFYQTCAVKDVERTRKGSLLKRHGFL